MTKKTSSIGALALPTIDESKVSNATKPILSLKAIKTAEELDWASQARRDLKALEKEIDQAFKPLIDLAKKTRDKYLKPVKEALEKLDELIKAYLAKQAERARLDAERERQKLLSQAVKLESRGKEEVAEGLRSLAESVEDKTFLKEKISSATDSLGVRKQIKWEVVDINLVPDEFIIREPNRSKINELVKEKGLQASIPGIRVYEEFIPVTR